MAVREYIGARYVPIFGRKDETSIQWDNTKPYEPLTVVLYQGNSYTSRQYVPTGIPITDESYWALTGNYNAQVEAYRNEVQTFDNRITANSDAIGNFNEELGQFEDEVRGALATAGHKRVAIYFGNSYTNGEGSTTGDTGLRALTSYLFDENYRFTAGGTCFQTYSNHDQTFSTLMDRAIASTEFDNNEVTDIIYHSAMGDTRALCEGRTIESAVNATIAKARVNFPNAKNYICFCDMVAGRNTQASYSPKWWLYQLRVHQVFLNLSANKQFIYLGWIGWNGNNVSGNNAADGYHPNDAGYELLASNFINAYAGITPYQTKKASANGVNIFADDPFSGRIYIPSTLTSELWPDGIEANADYKLCDLVTNSDILGVVPLQTQTNMYQVVTFNTAGDLRVAVVWVKIEEDGNAALMIRFRQSVAAPVANMGTNRQIPYACSITAGLTPTFA